MKKTLGTWLVKGNYSGRRSIKRGKEERIMATTLKEAGKPVYHKYQNIMMIRAWGFVIAIASFLFLYIGYKIDQYFGTAPKFMFGLFFLALFICIGSLYQEARLRRKEV